MFSTTSLVAIASLAVSQVAAHGGVLSYSWSGQWYWGWQPYDTPTGQTSLQRPWSSYNPIQNATDPTIACNDDGTSGALQLTATVAAGTAITAYWNQIWPHAIGPMFTYLAQCPGTSCTSANAKTLQWFKIDQAGLLSGSVGNGSWGSGLMITQNSSWTTTIPKTVPSGAYLIRFETIALHSLPAQFYPECAQITITGGGSLAPTAAELVTFPGGYSNSDPGLTVDVYTNAALTTTSYTLPGPPLYAGAVGTAKQPGSGSGSSTPPPSSSSASTPASTVKSSSSSTPSKSSSSAIPTQSGTVAEYGQCGGQGWTGATACVSPFSCKALNAYYSQCT